MGMTVLFKGNFHSLNGNFSSNPCRLTKSYAFSLVMAAVNMLEERGPQVDVIAGW